MIHKDITGRIIKAGDAVACAHGGTHNLFVGIVDKLNSKTVTVTQMPGHSGVHRNPKNVVVLNGAL